MAELAHLRRLVAKGIPLTVAQAGRARRLIAALVHGPHCSRLADASLNLAAPAKPVWPPPGGVGPTVPIRARLRLAQELITALQYNHTDAVTYFTVDKARPTCRVMDTARDIIRHGLPIRCVEAVFLAMYLTAGWREVERIPLRMRSVVVDDEGVERSHAHIVLLIRERALDETGAVRDNLIDEASKGRVDETDRSKSAIETPVERTIDQVRGAGNEQAGRARVRPVRRPHLERGAGALQGRVRQVEAQARGRQDRPPRGTRHFFSPSLVCWRHVAVECGSDKWDDAMRTLEAHDARCCGGGVGTRRHYDKWRCDGGQMWTNDVDKLCDAKAEGAGERMERPVGGRGRGRAASGRGVSRRVVAGEIAGGRAPSRSARAAA